MYYYKIISGDVFMGIATSFDMRRWQEKHQIILSTNEDKAEYVQCDEKLYHASWMKNPTGNVAYEIADVINIQELEYESLKSAIQTNQEIVIENPPEEEQITTDYEQIKPDVTVEYVRDVKLKEMNNTCQKMIQRGFDVVLSDEKIHHFSMTTQDQLNLITCSSFVAMGQQQIPYHADNQLCVFYSVNDIQAITNAAVAHKTYHVTYFNSLKKYINSLESIDQIQAIYYGVEVPKEYESEVLKTLIG